MNLYECIFIARPEMSPAQIEALSEKFSKVVLEHEGKVGKQEYCGLRNLAYPIRKNRKGHYVLLNIAAAADVMKEVERQMSINEDVMRYLTVRVDDHDNNPSALLKSTRYAREGGRRDFDRDDSSDEKEGSLSDSTTPVQQA